jgi:hypothetical protein
MVPILAAQNGFIQKVKITFFFPYRLAIQFSISQVTLLLGTELYNLIYVT